MNITRSLAGRQARVAFVAVKTDPIAVARWVPTNFATDATRDEAPLSGLHQWSIRGHSAALAWAEKFPEGALRERARQESR